MKEIRNQTFDEERALYGQRDVLVADCRFDGPADGESAFKEGKNLQVEDCFFNLRYPFWHDDDLLLTGSEMTPLCRAALWYTNRAIIRDCKLHGIKAVRECSDVTLENCHIISEEFGWFTRGLTAKNCHAESAYFMLQSENLTFENLDFKGKYSFQYLKNGRFANCNLDTKDAFWHAENVVIRDSVIKGEYLAWYSDGLTLENCTIIGTQPFCYCRNLRLVNCKMLETDLCFEKSQVEATVTTPVISVKNPRSGNIYLPAVEELIYDDEEAKGIVHIG